MHLLSFENCASILKQSSDLIAGYLFGSYAKNTQQNSSDIDLAFLFQRGKTPRFEEKLEMKEALSSHFKKEVDLVFLNEANPILKHQIFQYGKLLFNRDPKILNSFFIKSLFEYDDIKRYRVMFEKNLLKGRLYGRS